MKIKLTTAVTLIAASITLAASLMAQQAPAPKPASPSSTTTAKKTPAAQGSGAPVFSSNKEKASYAIGVSIGRRLQQDGMEPDPSALLRGMKDAMAGDQLAITEDEARASLTEYQKEAHEKQEAKMKVVGEANQKEGTAFLAANKSKEGVVTLPSGLQYKIEKQGTGPKPAATDTVECNYRGTLINGKEFDSSYKRGQPASFPVGQVIKGWTEVLQLMPVGSKYQVVIPAELAYGTRGAGADIGPNATLVFEIELLSIKTPPAPPAAKPAEPAK